MAPKTKARDRQPVDRTYSIRKEVCGHFLVFLFFFYIGSAVFHSAILIKDALAAAERQHKRLLYAEAE
jgi:hypothetical protein